MSEILFRAKEYEITGFMNKHGFKMVLIYDKHISFRITDSNYKEINTPELRLNSNLELMINPGPYITDDINISDLGLMKIGILKEYIRKLYDLPCEFDDESKELIKMKAEISDLKVSFSHSHLSVIIYDKITDQEIAYIDLDCVNELTLETDDEELIGEVTILYSFIYELLGGPGWLII